MKQRSVIDDKAFDPNIGTAKTLAENNRNAGIRCPSLCRRYSKCEIISPPLIHAQPAGSRANRERPLPSSSSNSVQSDPNERTARNYGIAYTRLSIQNRFCFPNQNRPTFFLFLSSSLSFFFVRIINRTRSTTVQVYCHFS